LLRGRGNGYIREASPLFDSPLVSLSLKGEGDLFLKEGLAPLLNTLALLPSKELRLRE